ncbi:MAG: alanine--tRNA ligase [Oscillospiraceae bacterium]|jgi:alanyl-tRNA synthetase|nr:alanine--tRNA ligase [Oscillospiraceae bacterium]
MTANELRRSYIDFFTARGHAEIPSASLIPENDPSVLFTTAGMHPLVPYLLGEGHPAGNRLCDCQKCLRTDDIDEVGDASHLTFFEMLGNWSLGDYFKRESITLSHELLTKALGIPQEKISVTVFAGEGEIPPDAESPAVWEELGYPAERIFAFGIKENFWSMAGAGPCGPDTEIFYDTGKEPCSAECSPACNCGKYVEIWNNVFMEYYRAADGALSPLERKNVDTGLGLERVLCLLNGKQSVFETELFAPLLEEITALTGAQYADGSSVASGAQQRAFRIIADHLRAAVFILGDDKAVQPSNVDQGYILRRLIRRAYRYLSNMNAPDGAMVTLARTIVALYKEAYPELERNAEFICEKLEREEKAFRKALEHGLKKAEKFLAALPEGGVLPAEQAFKLYDTFGFPVEFTQELTAERGFSVDMDGFRELFAEHQAKSREGAAQKFKGGLADSGDATTRLHTATHLLGAALRQVLSDDVRQRGSNITPERLRFDFSFERKMTPEEVAEAEMLVNQAIGAAIPVVCTELTVDEARESGAIGVFGDRYGERVKVYSIGDVSKEICGGPHAANTAELGHFVIKQETSSSAGVRRIKAVLE